MNRTPRNQSLLSQLSEHNPFKAELAHRFFKIGNDFERDVADIGDDGRRSQRAKVEDAQARAQKALLELADAEKLITDYRKQTESLRAEMKSPNYDRADISAALLRRELRDRAASMSFGQRSALTSGPRRSVEFIDALLEQPAWVSGINLDDPNERELYEEARQSRLREINGELMTALEARGAVEAEILMVANIIRNDVTSAATDLASSRAA
jgi:hypothetical protein